MSEDADEPTGEKPATNTPGGDTSGTVSPGAALPSFLLARDIFAAGIKDESKKPKGTLAPIQLDRKDVVANPSWDMVELFNITFFGKSLSGSTIHAIADGGAGDYELAGEGEPRAAKELKFNGVREDMAKSLISAEQRLFNVLTAPKGAAPPDEAQFNAASGVGSLGAYQFRRGLHTFGTAIDLDVGANPYIPTRRDSLFGGEEAENPSDKAEFAANVYRPCVEVYDRACHFVYGADKNADVKWVLNGDTETTEQIYQRFSEVDIALKIYLRMVFTPMSAGDKLLDGNVIATAAAAPRRLHTVAPFETFVASMRARYQADTKFKAVHESTLKTALESTAASPDELKPLYEAIKTDHETLRRGWVNGAVSLKREKSKVTGVSLPSSRDPCLGFLGVRLELVKILRDDLKMRWGICDFAGASGDVMHFDLGASKGMSRTSKLVVRKTPTEEPRFFTLSSPPKLLAVSVGSALPRPVPAGSTLASVINAKRADTILLSTAGFTTGGKVEFGTTTPRKFTSKVVPTKVTRTNPSTTVVELALKDAPAGGNFRVRLRNEIPGGPSLEEFLLTIEET